jgi:hypothetical protein
MPNDDSDKDVAEPRAISRKMCEGDDEDTASGLLLVRIFLKLSRKGRLMVLEFAEHLGDQAT